MAVATERWLPLVGIVLADLRYANRLTQAELAKRCGLGEKVIASIEQGRAPLGLKIKYVADISAALNSNLAEVITQAMKYAEKDHS